MTVIQKRTSFSVLHSAPKHRIMSIMNEPTHTYHFHHSNSRAPLFLGFFVTAVFWLILPPIYYSFKVVLLAASNVPSDAPFRPPSRINEDGRATTKILWTSDSKIRMRKIVKGELENLKKVRKYRFHEHLMKTTGLEIRPFYFDNAKSPSVDPDIISLATQFGLQDPKLTRLVDIANRWDGYISTVVYIDARSKDSAFREEAIAQVEAFRRKHEDLFDSRVDFHLVIDNRNYEAEDRYPNNFLRNAAMDYALTDTILLLDIDFIPSRLSHEDLLRQMHNLDFASRVGQPKALILPTFELNLGPDDTENEILHDSLPSSKAALLDELLDNIISNNFTNALLQPKSLSYFPSHGPTNYDKWFTTTKEYTVKYQLFFEPFFVVRRAETLPLLWEHFTGFGRSKQAWVEELALAGFDFHVDPNAFIVHINHQSSQPSLRIPRPSVIKQYTEPFQFYLQKKYHGTLWDPKDLQETATQQINAYYKKKLRICRSRSLKFQVDGRSEEEVNIPYQCKGEHYNKFGGKLMELVKSGSFGATAGTQNFPLPTGSTVLVLGNSHTQQLVDTMICQYNDVIKKAEILDAKASPTGQARVSMVVFKNNAKLYNLAENSDLQNKKMWKKIILALTTRNINSFDAIILGDLGSYDAYGSVTKPSKLTAAHVASAFQGPIVIPGSFSANATEHFEETREMTQRIKKYFDRNNIEVLDARRFVPSIGECGSNNAWEVKLCDGRRRSSDASLPLGVHPENMHRCVGLRGGHPDLISWQVVDFLHAQMPTNTSA